MKEDVCPQLPQKELFPDQNGNESKIDEDLLRRKSLEEKDPGTAQQEILNPWSQTTTPEGHAVSGLRVAHDFPLEAFAGLPFPQNLAQTPDFDSANRLTKGLTGNSEIPAICMANQIHPGKILLPVDCVEPVA